MEDVIYVSNVVLLAFCGFSQLIILIYCICKCCESIPLDAEPTAGDHDWKDKKDPPKKRKKEKKREKKTDKSDPEALLTDSAVDELFDSNASR